MSSSEQQTVKGPSSGTHHRADRSKRSESAERARRQVFSRTQLRFLAFGSLLIVLAISGFVIVKPSYLEFDAARITVCLLVSLYLAIFFFVFWPQELEVKAIPIINLPVRVTGPIVLWFAVLALLLKVLTPQGSNWAFYTISKTGFVPYLTDTEIKNRSGSNVTYYLIPKTERGEKNNLEGILIKFSPGEDSIQAVLTIPLFEPLPVTFDRAKDKIDLSELKRKTDSLNLTP